MTNWQRNLIGFFYGRNGVDDLYKFHLKLYFLVLLINLFVKSFVLSGLELVLVFLILFRSFSKNLVARRKENAAFLKIKRKISKWVERQKRKWQDRHTHMYKRCKNCQTILRLPLKKGRHKVICPNCKKEFEVVCYRDEKVEVIKKGRKK